MILMNDFKSEPAELRTAMLNAMQRVLDSGWFVLGNEGTTFEAKWAAACGLNFGVGVGNGLDAIEITLRGLGIGPGDEVITTPMTAFATVLAILRAGAKPVLADIEPESALLSLQSARRCLGPATKAVLLVHLYGQVRNIKDWQKFCQKHNLYLLEDCAQAHGAMSDGQVAGSFGLAGAYSFYPTKNLGALGDAGMLVTNDADLAERAATIRNYGQSIRYHHPELGMNSRLDELQAALLLERLKWLPKFTARRREIATQYNENISNRFVKLLGHPKENSAHVYHLYVITCSQRQVLQAYLQKNGVQALIHYPIPAHKQLPCTHLKQDPQGLTVSETHADCCLSLPCHPQMEDKDIQHIIEVVNSFKP
ncbi:DegT/DnrJ/EryC1/StrS family aminotransferase [Desulfovibrionales bacterium]